MTSRFSDWFNCKLCIFYVHSFVFDGRLNNSYNDDSPNGLFKSLVDNYPKVDFLVNTYRTGWPIGDGYKRSLANDLVALCSFNCLSFATSYLSWIFKHLCEPLFPALVTNGLFDLLRDDGICWTISGGGVFFCNAVCVNDGCGWTISNLLE